ncbi:putative bifunctional transcriptional activator/DNA repair enzyme AlkA [Frankia canadensis]|uniref:DNA-3-methyladenine glycosylase II n=1 Tax=Frankia canadensis TaxID=1836972 RepID=A0A2I2L0Z8_9ACTN|nr:AlkA N-terminal domain-containing protein [Frankia canadensis]SNQ51579.1 putative bifunctional transcriptional activator/DNA repair enzyme AlkA [Frankia canadensis]SOU58869.1 putative bifunctional transcriptional activator/DNA repair enzyme AlkA [Frankia canadensis]
MTTEQGRFDAVASRDARFDGTFYFAVTTTGIYCRPSCPAVRPRPEHIRFFPTAAAAHRAGFRACRRCRPDTVPGCAQWNVRADVVGRAMRLIGDGVVDREGVGGLAARLGYSSRQLHRHLTAEVGAGPLALARAQRAHAARLLLQTSELSATDVAFAAGFASVRQFNDTIRMVYAATPRELRDTRAVPREGRQPDHGEGPERTGLVVRLGYRPPLAIGDLFDHLDRRALAGAEEIVGEPGRRRYRRTLRLARGHAIAEVDESSVDAGGGDAGGGGANGTANGTLRCRLVLSDPRDLTAAVARVRRLFDLDADPHAVAERLRAVPALAPLVAARPGLRTPGAVDPHELAVRAVLGQQVSLAAARRLGAALVAAHGEPLAAADGGLTHLFPEVAVLADADLSALGMPGARRDTLRRLSVALADGRVTLDVGVDRDTADRALRAVRGIGPWTAAYVRMRALGDPDVLPVGDAALRVAARGRGIDLRDTSGWSPWRSYGTQHLWTGGAGGRGPRVVAAYPDSTRDGDPVPGHGTGEETVR